MGPIELVIFAIGVLVVVTIIAILVRLHYIIQQQGIQISILLKHEKEGYTPWMRHVRQYNYSQNYNNDLIPSDKQIKLTNKKYAINNTRAMQPSQALDTNQLANYSSIPVNDDGLAGHVDKSQDLNISPVDSMQAGNLDSVDYVKQTNYNDSQENAPAVDQSGVVNTDITNSQQFKESMMTGNQRSYPAFIESMTAGVKQANEGSKTRSRMNHSGILRKI